MGWSDEDVRKVKVALLAFQTELKSAGVRLRAVMPEAQRCGKRSHELVELVERIEGAARAGKDVLGSLLADAEMLQGATG